MVQVHNGCSRLLFEHQADSRMEIASLTKTMTCLLVLLLTEKLRIDTTGTYVKVNEKASKLMGTTAGLLYADHVRLADIIYGLMLPSGNDAALALA
jgi:D-alanyl-D-alanine carboxypeptidase (penicillin-binding protein 5/6)